MRQELANRIRSVMDGQRLVSLDTLLALGNGLNELAQGKPVGDSLIPLAGELREFEMPRPMFTSSERSEWAAGFYNTRHSSLQTRTDLVKIIKSPNSRKELVDARGIVVPFLRDTLVGLNYAYYEPPGAQILLNNPLSSARMTSPEKWRWEEGSPGTCRMCSVPACRPAAARIWQVRWRICLLFWRKRSRILSFRKMFRP